MAVWKEETEDIGDIEEVMDITAEALFTGDKLNVLLPHDVIV